MKRDFRRAGVIAGLIFGLLAVGCSVPRSSVSNTSMAHLEDKEASRNGVQSADELGEDVARHLQGRYDENRQDCGSKTAPAPVCSGLLGRSTTYDDSYHSWMPNPLTDAGGVVFFWLRQDANVLSAGSSSNGFFVYPRSVSDGKGMTQLAVRCGFPLEAGSKGDDRCHFKWAPCHQMKPPVTTAIEWIDTFQKGSDKEPDDQCAFAIDIGLPDTAYTWMQLVGVRQLLQSKARNEVIVRSWRGTDESAMPVEAFFYRTFAGSDPGAARESARKDQLKFSQVTGRWVPVIHWVASDAVIGGARFTYDRADQAMLPGEGDGRSVARYIQSRYDSGMTSCPGTPALPSYECSGLLIRSTMYSDLYYSWRPNPATADWGVSFSWLRKDSNFADSYPTGNGFIVYPVADARRLGLTTFDVRCVFPRDAWSASPDRCLWHQNGNGPRTMTKLCHLHESPILTASDWKKAGYDDDENQCAFSVAGDYAGRAEAWRQMIEVRRLDAVRWRNELIVKGWTGLDDAKIPIEAFFYRPESRPDKPDPLDGARQDQRDFFKLTGRWVPVIRWDPTESVQGGARFTYRDTDQRIPPHVSSQVAMPLHNVQESGADVVRHLLARMAERYDQCGSDTSPAFVCSGILIRGTTYSANFHVWIPNPSTAGKGISFSWIRGDSDMTSLYGNNGFIVYPKKYASDHGYLGLNVLCGYPRSASTDEATHRCRTACQDLSPSVTTAKQWIDRFTYGKNQCAFGVEKGRASTATAFTQVALVRQLKKMEPFNEIVLEAWPSNTHAGMPVEAFWYQSGSVHGLADAMLNQQDFKSTAGRWVPIVKWIPPAHGSASSFSYSDADQAVKP